MNVFFGIFFGIFSVVTIVTAGILADNNYTTINRFLITGSIAILTGFAVAMSIVALELRSDLKKRDQALMIFRRLFRDDKAERFDQGLREKAEKVRETAEKLLLIQHVGVKGLKETLPPEEKRQSFWNQEDPNKVRESLEIELHFRQSYFYECYDEIRLVHGLLDHYLRDRDWKAYAGEPDIHERLKALEKQTA